jgi:hypothetical protein
LCVIAVLRGRRSAFADHGFDDHNRNGDAARYLDIGAAPDALRTSRLTVTVPVTVGLRLDNYYELAMRDHRFGFCSVGGIVSVSIVPCRSWPQGVRSGAEYQGLGTTGKRSIRRIDQE